jgi:hypothetical protein
VLAIRGERGFDAGNKKPFDQRNTMNIGKLKFVQTALLVGTVALFAGCKKQESTVPPVSRPAGAPAGGGIVSAEKNSFNEVASKLDAGGNFYLYLSTEQALSRLSQNIAVFSNLVRQMPAAPALGGERISRIFEVVDGVVKDSGVEQISGFGASSIAREKGFYYSKVIVHHYAGQGEGLLWTALGKEPHRLKELDLLPEDTAFAAYADLDAPLVLNSVLKHLKQLQIPDLDKGLAEFPEKFKDATGTNFDDVLGSLGGGGYGVIFTLNEAKQITMPLPATILQIPEPGLALFFKVKNDAIYNRLDQLASGNILFTRGELSGAKTITLNSAIEMAVKLKPTLARVGDYIFLASSDDLLREIIEVQNGKKDGYKSTAEFKRLSQGIPNEGNNFTLISEKFGKSFSQALQGLAGAQSGEMGALGKTMQNMMATNAAAIGYSVGVNGPEGWESYANGNKSLGSTAMIVPAVAAVGLVSAIAIPNFVRARTTSQQNACISNLRMIDAAKAQWALENHKQNTDTPTKQDLTPYLGLGPSGRFPVCPDGGTYIIGTVGEKPRCSIPGHALP